MSIRVSHRKHRLSPGLVALLGIVVWLIAGAVDAATDPVADRAAELAAIEASRG